MTATLGSTAARYVRLLAGKVVGSYLIGRTIGTGNFGVVFEAEHVSTKAKVAVKVLTRTKELSAITDFQNESLLLKQLNPCEGVVDYIDGGLHEIERIDADGFSWSIEIHYLVTTLASGSLDELLLDPVTRSEWSWVDRLQIWRSAVKSLMQMHLHGVVHRDLKASNCLLLVRKNVSVIRFGDLGRARDLSASPHHPPQAYLWGRGDPTFAGPEALYLQGGMSPDEFLAADYYTLGSLLVEIITGQSLTSLTLGDPRVAMEQGRQDHLAGRRRDLAGLLPNYRTVIAGVVAELPSSIRADAVAVLESLCHPDPGQRLGPSPFSRDRALRERLEWILRRADIMIQRVIIESRQERRREREIA